MGAVEIKHFEMLDLRVSEQDRVIAYGLLGVGRGNQDIKGGFVDILILERDLFEASAFVSGLRAGRADVSREDWE